MRAKRLFGLTMAAALLAGACGATASPSPSATAVPSTSASGGTPPSAAAPSPSTNPLAGKTIRVAKAGDNAFDDAAVGYWMKSMTDKYGVKIELNVTDSADTSLRAVVANSADMAVAMSLTGTVNLVQQSGTDVKLLAADTYASDYQIVSKASIATTADLNGKVEGISAPGDASEITSHLCITNAGADYGSLKIVRIGGTSARVAALLAGHIDLGAAHIADAKAAVAKSKGSLKIILDCGKSVGNYPVTGMVASGAWTKANPELAQAAVNAYVDAMRWAASDKQGYLDFTKTWVPDADPAESASNYDYFKSVGFWPVNGGLDLPSLEVYLGYAAQLQILTGRIPTTDQWVDDTFVKVYLAANGTK